MTRGGVSYDKFLKKIRESDDTAVIEFANLGTTYGEYIGQIALVPGYGIYSWNGAIWESEEPGLSEYAKLAISISLADIKTAILSSTLIPNQWYLITDYQTSGYIKGTTEIFTAPVEPIYIKATSVNTISANGFSSINNEDVTVDLSPVYTYSSDNSDFYTEQYKWVDGVQPVASGQHWIEFNVDGQSPSQTPSFYWENKDGVNYFSTGDFEEGVDYEYSVIGDNLRITLLPDFIYYNEIDFNARINDLVTAYYLELTFYYFDGEDVEQTIYGTTDKSALTGTIPTFTEKSISFPTPSITVNPYIEFNDYVTGIYFFIDEYVKGVDYEITYADGVSTFTLLPAWENYDGFSFLDLFNVADGEDRGWLQVTFNYVTDITFNGIVGRYNSTYNFKANFDYRGLKTRRYSLTAPEYNSATSYIIGDVVIRYGSVYVCIQDSLNQEPALSNSRYWTNVDDTTARYTSSGINFYVNDVNCVISVDLDTAQGFMCFDTGLLNTSQNSEIIVADDSDFYIYGSIYNSKVAISGYTTVGQITDCKNGVSISNGHINVANSSELKVANGRYYNLTNSKILNANQCLLRNITATEIRQVSNSVLNGMEQTTAYYLYQCIGSQSWKRNPALIYLENFKVYGPMEDNPILSKIQNSTWTNALLKSSIPYINGCTFASWNGVTIKAQITSSNCSGSWGNCTIGGNGNSINGNINISGSTLETLNGISGTGNLNIVDSDLKQVYSITLVSANVQIQNCFGNSINSSTFYGNHSLSNLNINGLFSGTFGANPVTITNTASSRFNLVGHGLVANQRIQFSSTGTMPSGIDPGNQYYVSATDLLPDSFKITSTQNGASVINPGTTYSGTLTYQPTNLLTQLTFFGQAYNNSWQGTYTKDCKFGSSFNFRVLKGFNQFCDFPLNYSANVTNASGINGVYGVFGAGVVASVPLSTLESGGSFGLKGSYFNTAVTLNEANSVVLADGTFTVNLPNATTCARRIYFIKNIGSGTITIDPYSTQLIDGAGTLDLAVGEKVICYCDGNNWFTR